MTIDFKYACFIHFNISVILFRNGIELRHTV